MDKDVLKILNESDNQFPPGSFAEWYGQDLSGQVYKGTIDCSEQNLTSLYGCPSIVTDNFYCSDNQLTSLQGAPQEVRGNFVCRGNNLTTLKGAPQEVKDGFYCDNNKLTSLQGAPQKVGDNFYCDNNKLTSLQGAPEYVRGEFWCASNQLTSLQGAPQEVGWNFSCSYNKLTSLQGAPQKVGDSFYCDNNKLTSLQGAPQEVGKDFNCSDNQLTSLQGAPQEVGRNFNCKNNPNLTSLDGIGKVDGKVYSDIKTNFKPNSSAKKKKGDITLQDIKDHMINSNLDEFEISLNTTKYYFELNDDELRIYPETSFTDTYTFFENSDLEDNSDLDGMYTTLREFNSVLKKYDYEMSNSSRFRH